MKILYGALLLFSAFTALSQNGICLKAVRSDQAPYMPTGPHSIATGDFNNDSHVDFAIVKTNSPELNILLGDGTGVYNAGTPYTQSGPMSQVITGDFNNDGVPDLATSDAGADKVSIYIGIGNGTFSTAVDFTVDAGPSSICAADFDGDGNQDIASANSGTTTISILMGNGAGSF